MIARHPSCEMGGRGRTVGLPAAGLRLVFLLALAFASVSVAIAQQPQVPSVHAVSLQRGNAISRSSTARFVGPESHATNSKSSTRMAAVKVTLRSFSEPTAPYEVQCFFVAKNHAKTRSIFDMKKVLSSAKNDEINIFSAQLDGGSREYEQSITRAPLYPGQTEGPLSSERMIRRSTTTTYSGNKLEGWIVRVISGGKVVRTEASLHELKTFAERESAMLDERAASAPLMR